MTRGQQILAQLLTADIELGKVVVKGSELFLAGQRVEPLLTYETVTPEASRSSVRLSAASPVAVREDEPMAIQFAALPEERLTMQRQELLVQRGRVAERMSVWAGNFAPLPPDDLLVSRGVEPGVGREPVRSLWDGCAPLPRDPLTEGKS